MKCVCLSESELKFDEPDKKLEYANKLIFVKDYQVLESLIEELIEGECAQ